MKTIFRDYGGRARYTPARIFGAVVRFSKAAMLEIPLQARNRLSRSSIVGEVPAVVSMTTHGDRIRKVHIALESIARGGVRPQRMILWVDHECDIEALPRSLRRMIERGLEVKGSGSNFGPHTKYYPYVRSIYGEHEKPLVTADDDLIYPRYWLAKLYAEYAQSEDPCVICYRAHRITMRADGIAPYKDWTSAEGVEPSLINFATGVSGVIYPPKMLEALKASGTAFEVTCPKADDVWLHAVALRNSIQVRQVERVSRAWPTVVGSQRSNLVSTNAFGSGNDSQIRATYSRADIAVLLAQAVDDQ